MLHCYLHVPDVLWYRAWYIVTLTHQRHLLMSPRKKTCIVCSSGTMNRPQERESNWMLQFATEGDSWQSLTVSCLHKKVQAFLSSFMAATFSSFLCCSTPQWSLSSPLYFKLLRKMCLACLHGEKEERKTRKLLAYTHTFHVKHFNTLL